MAISIYLDTHHLSRIADGKQQVARFIGDPEYLFAFSTSHVVECLPKEPKENAGAIARLNIILGERSAWLFGWGKVSSLELEKPFVTLADLFCRKDQLLFADYKMDRSSWLRRAREDIKDMLRKQVADENVRRSIQAKLLKHGKLTKEAFRVIKSQFADTLRRVYGELPEAISLFTDNDFYAFLEGKVSEEEFKAKFMETMASPTALATMSAIPELSSILEFSRIFWSQMDDLAGVLSKFIVGVRQDMTRMDAGDYTRERVRIRRYLEDSGFREAIALRVAGVDVSLDDLRRMPGTRFFVDVFSEYILEKLDRYANPSSPDFKTSPRFKRSDVADFTHLFYCPYVDIFGCDGAMRDRMRRAGYSIEKVITTDDELELKLLEMRNVGFSRE